MHMYLHYLSTKDIIYQLGGMYIIGFSNSSNLLNLLIMSCFKHYIFGVPSVINN